MFSNKNFDDVPPEIDYTEYWETKDGDLIAYKDMTDDHLMNAHAMMSRGVANFMTRCMNRNEVLDLPDYISDKIYGLETEMEKRNLIHYFTTKE